MSAWLYDVRAAIASAWRQPFFTALLVVVLSAGIGAAVAMFSVLDAVVLRPLPYGDPQRLMWLWSIRADGTRTAFAIQELVDLRERGSESIGAFAPWSANLTGVGTPERQQGMRTSANARRPSADCCSTSTSRSRDPYVAVALLLAAVAAAACYVPATRAARIDPLRVLRD